MIDQPHDLPTADGQRSGSVRAHTPLHSSVGVTPHLAAASDVGHRHILNQDAYRVRLVPGADAAVLVIADGVSASLDSDIASQQAADTAAHHVVAYLAEHPLADSAELAPVLAEAFHEANQAVLSDSTASSPAGSSTLIVAVCGPNDVTVANIGDSRAYWVADSGTPERLSIDDSLVQEWVSLGMDPDAAPQSVNVHAITKWIGPDAPDVTPRVLGLRPTAPGWVLVCSDGLWNYAEGLPELGELARSAIHDRTAEQACLRLVDWALDRGGRDNVTVALARWEPA